MSDLEGLTRNLLRKGYTEKEILVRLAQEYQDYKEIDKATAFKFSKAILDECQKSDISLVSDPFVKGLLDIHQANVSVGKQGVGCRGIGDFFVHKLIAELSETETKAFLAPSSLDDAGAVRLQDIRDFDTTPKDLIIVSKMEGIHSRLSDFPFICGFHVTRACLRDLYVKGAKPISIMVDAHLGDDADVGKLFDFMSGISTISELADVPITAGSTLRIGGDMVIGNRLVGGISAVGVCNRVLARRNINVGDRILMTEGAGGGTITTTAIYSGNHNVVKETINIKFLKACERLLKSEYLEEIHAMCDVTNGGLRGDLYEINYEAKCGVTIYEEEVRKLINHKVLDLLKKVDVDYLGVSLDALLIYCSEKVSNKIISDLKKIDVNCAEIGYVDDSYQVKMIYTADKQETILPRFRESAYTKIKQEIGEEQPESKEEMELNIEEIAIKAIKKRERIIEYIRTNG
ncbi:MAG: AIR synthase-related protein [Promethearchaeota archaeon]|jgi:hydrogenase expression/formation protein